MRLSARESLMAWGTLSVILVAIAYGLTEPKMRQWRELRRTRLSWSGKVQIARRLLDQQAEWKGRLEDLRARLPEYPADQDVVSQILKTLQGAADTHGLLLVRREPEKEKRTGDLYEVSVNCTWEGSLEALVHFLYALQTQGAIVDVRQLTVQPAQGGPGRLKGVFSVDCSYSRAPAGGGSPRQAAVPKPAPATNQVAR